MVVRRALSENNAAFYKAKIRLVPLSSRSIDWLMPRPHLIMFFFFGVNGTDAMQGGVNTEA
jgi:hypothetical protein